MKYLNKIIFINSANIPYAEIAVDGNVHFTGTQGVGKSTVLRALLFFYNADKQRLGIQQGQKPFDEFYFRQSNSYILYEVMRDNGAYTILVSRYQGRASWRFIDAPYRREWLITDDKQVLSDWVKIREIILQRIDNNDDHTDPCRLHYERQHVTFYQYISVLLSQLLFQSYQATIGWLHQEANRNPQPFPLLDYRKHEDGYSLQPF